MARIGIRLATKCSPKRVPPNFLPQPLAFNKLMRLSGNFVLLCSRRFDILNRTNITITISMR